MFKQFYSVYILAAVLLISASFAGAAQLDLLTQGASGYLNGGYFVQFDPAHATGTGVIQPFLRIQSNGTEEGYNTDYRPLEYDESHSWTRSLLLSSVPTVTIQGIAYREFFLDINESSGGNNELLSLDKLQIFLGATGNHHGYPTGLGTKIWDIDEGPDGDSLIVLDYSLGSGSGSGDMLAYIPDSLFVGGDYVYLYSAFGLSGTKDNGWDSSDGFEEWSVRTKAPDIPEPGGLLALAAGLASVIGFKLRGRK